jgi:hypothetical protein
MLKELAPPREHMYCTSGGQQTSCSDLGVSETEVYIRNASERYDFYVTSKYHDWWYMANTTVKAKINQSDGSHW